MQQQCQAPGPHHRPAASLASTCPIHHPEGSKPALCDQQAHQAIICPTCPICTTALHGHCHPQGGICPPSLVLAPVPHPLLLEGKRLHQPHHGHWQTSANCCQADHWYLQKHPNGHFRGHRRHPPSPTLTCRRMSP